MTRVFVYGTLKRGGENHEWIKAQTFVASARTKPLYRMFDLGGYPGMIRSVNGTAIEGEVWDVDEAGLARLDVLEDIDGGEYERVLIELEGEFAAQRVEGYLFLRDQEDQRDVGACW
ncbi:MAG TPA: gamma-glutamylcyclotransferase [Verrucomicrobiales bacterium]|nr:gamma-glutamylcyclotransferase [Verrucomicrobiales bacterium]